MASSLARFLGIISAGMLFLGMSAAIDVAYLSPAYAASDTNDVRDEVFKLTNSERKKAGLKQLTMNTKLNSIAKSWSKNIAADPENYRHNPTYTKNYPAGWYMAGENLAGGQPNAKSVVRAWMGSPGHKANILNTSYTHIGIGVATTKQGILIYTQNFAGYTGKVAGDIKVKKKLKTSKPKISGTKKVGAKLKAKPGKWTKGTKLKYQWFADGKKIKGAKKKVLTLKISHRSKKISVKVTGTKKGYKTVSKSSAKTKKIAKKK